MRLPLLIFGITITFLARGQLAESFADSNFSANPVWTGTPQAWIVNAARQLQSSHPLANSSFWLTTPNRLALAAEWTIRLRLHFNTSSLNYTDIWLLSALENPEAPGNTGYFVRVGGSADEVALFRKDPAGAVKIIDGTDGVTNTSDNHLRLRVIRRADGQFQLLRGDAGSGSPLTSEGSITDSTYRTTAFFALQVRQSTSSFFGRHYFSEIQVQPWQADTTAPSLLLVEALNDSTLSVRFSEAVDARTALHPDRYSVSAGIGSPQHVRVDPADASRVILEFSRSFPPGISLLLTVREVYDLNGNLLLQDTDSFVFYRAVRYDVLLHEIMADPTPSQGLPATEYIEIRNVSPHNLNIGGWRIAGGNTLSQPFPELWLPADSLLLLTSSGQVASLSPYGRSIGLSNFPALSNEGTTLQLLDARGQSIHALAYEKSWYQNELKALGGWSLELIDPSNPCGNAWSASLHPQGGTPGRRNSVEGPGADTDPPVLLRAWCADSLTVLAVFDETLDSASLSGLTVGLENGPAILTVQALPPLFRELRIGLAAPLQRGLIYRLSIQGAADCRNNRAEAQKVKVGLAGIGAQGLQLNELLYAPPPGGSEYVEVAHRGKELIDLSRVFIGGRTATGELSNIKPLSATPFLLFPGDHAAVSENPAAVRRHYRVAQPALLLRVPGMPALADHGGTVALLDAQGTLLDEVRYDPKWQLPLIRDDRGIALERLSAQAPTQDRHNWHSASAASGYGTPTARNSQYRGDEQRSRLWVDPPVFTPDGDGIDDLALIRYEVEQAGCIGTVTLFNAAGVPVRPLVRNELMGRKGHWTWDGLDAQGKPAVQGTYVLLAEWFGLDGKRSREKRTVTLLRR